MTHAKETRPESTLSQVVALLQETGSGVRVTLNDVCTRAPWLPRNRVSASLACLTHDCYMLLERTGEKAAFGATVYMTLPDIDKIVWNGTGEPSKWFVMNRNPRKTRTRGRQKRSADVDHDKVDTLLTQASVLVDDEDYDSAMDTIRDAYFEIKNHKGD